MNLNAPPAAVTEMERRMTLSPDVIRFLTVRVEAHETEPSIQMRKSDRDERRDGERGGGGFRGERGGGFRGGERGGFRGGDRGRPRRDRGAPRAARAGPPPPRYADPQAMGKDKRTTPVPNPPPPPPGPPSHPRRKPCPFSGDNAPKIDYKASRLLGRYMSERGKIVPSRIT